MAAPAPPPKPFPWQTCLDIEGQEGGHYHDYVNVGLFDVISGTPRRVLELGCAGGMFGLKLKEKFPGTTVVGIEPGRAAAAVAATRLDRVINRRLEDVDFAAEGLEPATFDTMIAADVLEHLANPWRELVRVRPLLVPDAQLVASIPNVRNVALLANALVNGQWRYGERGLLDITHLRFFTLGEIARLFEETGYRLEGYAANVSPGLIELWSQNKDRDSASITLGRLTLADVRRAELVELCAEQFLVRARPQG